MFKLLILFFFFFTACATPPAKIGSWQPEKNVSVFSKNPARSVFYEKNAVAVAPSFLPFLEREGARLKHDPKAAVKVVGYTDDDGISAYSLAVAQRRIDEVVKILKKFGARPQQLQTYAVGKEKSFCMGDSECQRQMRRVDVEALRY